MKPLGIYYDPYDKVIIEVLSYNNATNRYGYHIPTKNFSSSFLSTSARACEIIYIPECNTVEDVKTHYPELFI